MPTAMQDDGPGQDMPVSEALLGHEPGTTTIDHAEPFHDSAIGMTGFSGTSENPMAMQLVGDVQLIPFNRVI